MILPILKMKAAACPSYARSARSTRTRETQFTERMLHQQLVDLLREQVTRRIDEVLQPDHAEWTRLVGKVIQLRAV